MKNPPSTSSKANRSASAESIVDRLFQKFHAMYGNQWADRWADVPMDAVKAEWGAALHGIEVEAIRLAIESWVTQGKAFPPSISEFAALSRQFVRKGPHRLALVDGRRGDGPPGGFQSLKDVLAKAAPKA